MPKNKSSLKKAFFLSPLWTVLISIPSFALFIYVLVNGVTGWLSYIAYAATIYALIISITGFKSTVKIIIFGISKVFHIPARRIMRTAFGRRFLKDDLSRAEMFLYFGFIFNMLYVIMKLTSGIKFRSVWFIYVSIYYILLAFIRLLLVQHASKNTVGQNFVSELKRYRMCGIMLLIMNYALTGIVVLIVTQNRSYEYPGQLLYAMAVFSIYSMIVAIVNLFKYRNQGSPVIMASKTINLVAALVSILSLETAIFAKFGDANDHLFRLVMTSITGGFVCLVVLSMAVIMIIRSTKQLRALK